MKCIIVIFYISLGYHLQRQSLKGWCRRHKDREKCWGEKSLVQHHLGQSSLRPGELDCSLEDEIPGADTGTDQAASQDEEPADPGRLEVGSLFLDDDLPENIYYISENISNIERPVSPPLPSYLSYDVPRGTENPGL